MCKSILPALPAIASAKAGLFAIFLMTASGTTTAQQNYYSVKFPDDKTIVSCGGTADTTWPEITYYANCNFNVGITVKDQVFNLNNTDGCKKILRTWKLLWWCDYNPNWPGPTYITNPGSTDVGPTIIGDSYNHGYLQYTQIIKIIDNAPPVYLNCPTAPVLFCDYSNNDPAQYGTRCEAPVDLKMKVTDVCSKSDLIITYRLYLDLDGNGSMETFRSSRAAGAWPIEKTIINDTISAKIVLPTGVGLPYGKHKIEWITNDHCGNESLCKYEFEVRDCKPPTVVCMNGLIINIMQSGMITLWDTDFLQYTTDNCTPSAQIKIGIRKVGTGTGFPVDTQSVTFDCNEIGNQFVEIWAVDAYGNADYCTTYVIIQDNIGACTPPGPVSGNVSTDQQQALAGAKILLKSNLAASTNYSDSHTDAQGNFAFAGAPGTCNYSIIPSYDTLPLLGVNTMDVMLTELHISGQTPLANPYRIIAADVNKDGQLNAADLEVMNNMILGISNTFPGNTAWRFVPSNHVFPNPAQPLSTLFPEEISTVCTVPSGLNKNFTAIKTGDVDGSVITSTRGEDWVIFYTTKQRFSAGEEVEVAIISPELSKVAGFQFTLEADPAYLTLQSAAPGTVTPRFGIFPEQNKVAASWYTTPVMEGVQTVMILKFIALQSGTLSQALQMNSSITEAEAYDHTLKSARSVLQFNRAGERNDSEGASDNRNAILFPVSPNPTAGPVAAAFFLPEAGSVMLTLTDLNGRVVATQNGYFEKGNHRVDMLVEESGLFFLGFQSASGTDVKRVVVRR
ncbi:MAG: T9SS type A sorting domain-containing protein [Saprospiraceae bacterium]|nr:T9SS type A sorting domain-containing protein [Saprospiraceae bacterium]